MYMQSSSHAYASSEEPGYFPCTIYETRSFNPLHSIAVKCVCEISCPLHPIAAKCARTSLPLLIVIAAPFWTWG